MGDIIVLIPLGVIGLIRWLSWLVRRIPAVLYRSYESDHVVPMSLVTPVYQEDPELFRQAIESWLANDLAEIICVIDQTDKASIEVARGYPVQIIVTDVPGKRDALRKGWEAATSPIVALVDSDTLWARDAREQILKPFADPKIGGVGTRQNVYNPENVWQNINDMYLDYRYFDEIASQTRVSRAVSCLSGRTAAYRRELLLEVSDDFMGETFLGVPCNSGEDKRLTSLILERGHQTYMQRNARVWSTFPPDPSTFFKQRLRWSRNTWRSDLRALKRRWIFRHKFLAFTTIDKAVASFTLMVAPAYMTWGLINLNWGLVSALSVWWIVSRAAKHLPHLHRKPLHFFIIPIFVLVSFAVALVKIYALLTVRKQRWLTRQVEVIDGEIVRTGHDEADETAEVDVDLTDHDHEQERPTLVYAGVGAAHQAAGSDRATAAAPPPPRESASPPPGPEAPTAWEAPPEAAAPAAEPEPPPSKPAGFTAPPPTGSPVRGLAPPTGSPVRGIASPMTSAEAMAVVTQQFVRAPADSDRSDGGNGTHRGAGHGAGGTGEDEADDGADSDADAGYENKEEMVDALLAELVDLPLRSRRRAQQQLDEEGGA